MEKYEFLKIIVHSHRRGYGGSNFQLKKYFFKINSLFQLKRIRIAFRQHIEVNNNWGTKYVFCEVLNLINLIWLIYCTDRFLAGHFLTLGFRFWKDDFTGKMDVLDYVFPKVTKCNFYKYGPSGTIQKHDILCVMALNVMNEKIFTFLWFWYGLLLIITILGLIWRLITIIFHARSAAFNGAVFSTVCPGRLNPWDMLTVTRTFAFSDWLFLYYLAKNMEPFLFREMLVKIANEMRGEGTPETSDNESENEDEELIDEVDGHDDELQPEDENKQNLLNNRAAEVRTVFLLNEDEKSK